MAKYMNENWKQIRLDKLITKIGALESLVLAISSHLEYFLNHADEKLEDTDTLFYSQESLEGCSEFLSDVKNDIYCFKEQIDTEMKKKALEITGLSSDDFKIPDGI